MQFLVDLPRPSQLNINPFLRGFYFSGIRPTIIEDVAGAMPEVQAVLVVATFATFCAVKKEVLSEV